MKNENVDRIIKSLEKAERLAQSIMDSIDADKKENIIGVPISSIVIKTDTTGKKKTRIKENTTSNTEKFECVFVKIGEEAKLRVVTTGIQDDTNIEITSGLAVDDEVITGPYNTVTKSLKTGDKIELMSSKEDESNKEED